MKNKKKNKEVKKEERKDIPLTISVLSPEQAQFIINKFNIPKEKKG